MQGVASIIPPLLVFATLWVPGHPLLVRLAPSLAADCRFPGRIALDCTLTLALLAPAMAIAFALQTSAGWLCAYYVALVIAALWAMRRSWTIDSLTKHFRGVAPAGALILLADLVLSLYAGPLWVGDAPIHLARIRSLVEEGFSIFDPAIDPAIVMNAYHLNVHHGLFAMVSALTGTDTIWVWAAGLPLAKLLVASGVFFAARSVFRTDRAAWASVAFAVGVLWTIPFLLYPNRLAAYCLVPLLIGLTVELLRGEIPSKQIVALLGLTAFVTGFVHPMIAGLAATALFPVLAAWGVLTARSSGTAIATSLRPVAAILAGVPFTITSYLIPSHPRESPRTYSELTREIGDTWEIIDPMAGIGAWGMKNAYVGLALLSVACAALFVLAVRRSSGSNDATADTPSVHRSAAIGLTAMITLVANLLYNPLFSTPLIANIGERWMIYRLGSVLVATTLIILPGALATIAFAAVEGKYPGRKAAAVHVTILAAALAGQAWAWTCLHPANWEFYSQQRYYELNPTKPQQLRLQRALKEEVPNDAVVLATTRLGKLVISLHSTNIVATPVGNTSGSLKDPDDRVATVRRLLTPKLAPAEEQVDELLRRYSVDFVLVHHLGRHLPWLKRVSVSETEVQPWRLYRIRPPEIIDD